MKKTIGEHIQRYLTKHAGEEEKIETFATFIEEFFTSMPEEQAGIHEAFYTEIEEFTDEIDDEMIEAIISALRHKNGELSGEKWSLEETRNVVKQYDVKTKIETCGKQFDCYKYWLALNYAYATHYSINRTINGYIDLAVDEYCNKNICFDDTIKKIFEKI
jgi:hypothetical protein